MLLRSYILGYTWALEDAEVKRLEEKPSICGGTEELLDFKIKE